MLALVAEDSEELCGIFHSHLPLVVSLHIGFFLHRRRKINDRQFIELVLDYLGSISCLPGVQIECLFYYAELAIHQLRTIQSGAKQELNKSFNLVFECLVEASKLIRPEEVGVWLQEAQKKNWVSLEKGIIEFWGRLFTEQSKLEEAFGLYHCCIGIKLPSILKDWTTQIAQKSIRMVNCFLDGLPFDSSLQSKKPFLFLLKETPLRGGNRRSRKTLFLSQVSALGPKSPRVPACFELFLPLGHLRKVLGSRGRFQESHSRVFFEDHRVRAVRL